MKNIAIVIRGMTRTWELCKLNIFAKFQRMCNTEGVSVIWFFDTWSESQNESYEVDEKNQRIIITESQIDLVDKEQIEASFVGLNLASVNIHPITQTSAPNSFLYLNYLSLLSRKRYEITHGITFDSIFLIRPDIVLTSTDSPLVLAEMASREWGLNQSCISNTFKNASAFCTDSLRSHPVFEMDRNASDISLVGSTFNIDSFQETYLRLAHRQQKEVAAPHSTIGRHLHEFNIPINADWDYMIVRNLSNPQTQMRFEDFEQFIRSSHELTGKDLMKWIQTQLQWYKYPKIKLKGNP